MVPRARGAGDQDAGGLGDGGALAGHPLEVAQLGRADRAGPADALLSWQHRPFGLAAGGCDALSGGPYPGTHRAAYVDWLTSQLGAVPGFTVRTGRLTFNRWLARDYALRIDVPASAGPSGPVPLTCYYPYSGRTPPGRVTAKLGNLSLDSMLAEICKLRAVRAVGLPAGLFADVAPRVVAWPAQAMVESGAA
jgi:hypothetical protein